MTETGKLRLDTRLSFRISLIAYHSLTDLLSGAIRCTGACHSEIEGLSRRLNS